MKKPVRKKPARKEPAINFKVMNQRINLVFGELNSIRGLVETLRASLVNRASDPNLTRVIDQMGRGLSEQIQLLAKELPPNKHDALAMKLDQLERRLALLEREATYTVRHVISKPMEENHAPEREEESPD